MTGKIIIGSDHGGYAAKLEIIKHLRAKGLEVTNIGTDSDQSVRYPPYARQVAGAVARGEYERGILVCSTGIGMSIAANKFKGIRAALCTSTFMAKMTRRHNDSNILCLGGRITGIFELLDIADTWLESKFEGGRHSISLGLISEMEEELGITGQDGSTAPLDRAVISPNVSSSSSAVGGPASFPMSELGP